MVIIHSDKYSENEKYKDLYNDFGVTLGSNHIWQTQII